MKSNIKIKPEKLFFVWGVPLLNLLQQDFTVQLGKRLTLKLAYTPPPTTTDFKQVNKTASRIVVAVGCNQDYDFINTQSYFRNFSSDKY
jgi:hypothetical protein